MIAFPNSKIIAFEGMDNCFKETNAKAFVKHLSYEYPFGLINFQSLPRYDEDSSLMIKKYLNGEFNREVLQHDPEVIKSFFMNDRLAYWKDYNEYSRKSNLETYLDKSSFSCFVFDRYNVSNVFYNNKTIRISSFEEEKQYGIPNPDIVVCLMYKDVNLYINELQKKKDRDMKEKDKDMLYHIWKLMKDINTQKAMRGADLRPVFVYCDDKEGNIKSKEKIESEIWKRVTAILNNMMKAELY